MGAWTVGATRTTQRMAAGADPADFVNRVVRWIPGDAMVLYGGAINGLRPSAGDTSSLDRALLGLFVFAAGLLVILGAFSKGPVKRGTFVKAALGAVAALIWSMSVPNSAWHGLQVFKDYPIGMSIAAAFGGTAFALLASGIELRLPSE